MNGSIRLLNAEKRFGFIKSTVTGVEYFFHGSALKNCQFDELEVNDEVTFEDTEGTKGPRAEDVYKV